MRRAASTRTLTSMRRTAGREPRVEPRPGPGPRPVAVGTRETRRTSEEREAACGGRRRTEMGTPISLGEREWKGESKKQERECTARADGWS